MRSPSHTEGMHSLTISWLYGKFEPYPFVLGGYLMHCKFSCVLDLYPLDIIAPSNECENERTLQKNPEVGLPKDLRTPMQDRSLS